MKVLSHEDDVLKNGYGVELAAIKREYYRICVGLVEDLAKAERLEVGRRRLREPPAESALVPQSWACSA